MDEPEPRSKTFRAGRDISAAVAVASLVAALIFNGFQLRDSAEQLKQSERSLALQRQVNDFQTLIAVSSTLEKSQAKMNEIISRSGNLNSQAAVLGVVAALRPNEPIAFALNHGIVQIPGASALWGNLLACNWQLARQNKYAPRFPRYFPELVAYVRRHQGGSCL